MLFPTAAKLLGVFVPTLPFLNRPSECLSAGRSDSVSDTHDLSLFHSWHLGVLECLRVAFLVAVGQHRFDAVYTLPCICMSLHSVFLT